MLKLTKQVCRQDASDKCGRATPSSPFNGNISVADCMPLSSPLKTSISAVAKRPSDASCLSVVSSNSTNRWVESFIVSYVGCYRCITACSKMCCSVVFGVTLRLFVINISSSSPTINITAYYQWSVTTCETVAVVHRRLCWQHWPVVVLTAGTKARYRLRITISAYPTCIRGPR